MAKTKTETVLRSIEAIEVAVGDVAFGQEVTVRKVYRKRAETFRRVRLTLADGTVKEFRERFRVPVTFTV